jgi:hypothetical protein
MGARARARGVEDGLGHRRLLRRWNQVESCWQRLQQTTNVVHEEAAEGRVSVSIYNHWL